MTLPGELQKLTSPDLLHLLAGFELQMRVVLVHVLARMAGQLLADFKRNVGIGHRRIEAVSEQMERQS